MKLSAYVTDRIYGDEIISEEEKVLVEFGVRSIINNIVTFLLVVSISCFYTDIQYGCLLYFLIFFLRKNAGGFHAKTKLRCFMISVGMIVMMCFCVYRIKWPSVVYIILFVFWNGIIFLKAPVGNQSKILDEVEQQVYRKRTRVVLEDMLFVLALLLRWDEVYKTGMIAFSIVAIAVLAGDMKMRRNYI